MKEEQKETSGWSNIVTAVERCLTQQNNINIGTRSIILNPRHIDTQNLCAVQIHENTEKGWKKGLMIC